MHQKFQCVTTTHLLTERTEERNYALCESVIIVTPGVTVIIILMSFLELFIYLLTQQANGQLECKPQY
jgi:hypothetical protein